MNILDLARPEIRDLMPYTSPVPPPGFVRLNANEAPKSPYANSQSQDINRYPEMRPLELQRAFANLYGVKPANVAPVRGSSEGIDLLIRAFCRAYTDNVITLPPCFEMYGAYAGMHGAGVRQVPLAAGDFSVDWDSLQKSCSVNTKIIFLCSPNNPTGNDLPSEDVLAFVEERAGKSLVVVDEAYVEFSETTSLIQHLPLHSNLVILRTLSKAYALAGARCGAVIGDPDIIRLVSAMSSPYAISTPVTELVIGAITRENVARAESQIEMLTLERTRLAEALEQNVNVERVWPSAANFLLVKFRDSRLVANRLENSKLLIRQFTDNPALKDCARITIGTKEETDLLLASLDS